MFIGKEEVCMKDEPQNLQLLVDKLNKDIDSKRIELSNLTTQALTLKRQDEDARKLSDAEYHTTRNAELEQVALETDKARAVKHDYERQRSLLEERESNVTKREKEVGDIKLRMDVLAKERSDIYQLKRNAEEVIKKAKESQGEIDGFNQSRQIFKGEMETREKAVKKQEKYYNDVIGQLEADKKTFEEEKKDLLARYANKKEVVSG